MYLFTATDGSLVAWRGVLRRINAEQFYDLQKTELRAMP
jgi:hypothetical protein